MAEQELKKFMFIYIDDLSFYDFLSLSYLLIFSLKVF